jgi:hypothetical protein
VAPASIIALTDDKEFLRKVVDTDPDSPHFRRS